MFGVVFVFLGSFVRLISLKYRSHWLLHLAGILCSFAGPSNMLSPSILSI